jgi:methionyl aminopeptidase
MINIRMPHEIALMKEAGKILKNCHLELRRKIKPGISTAEIDQFVEHYLKLYKATPEQKGYQGYKYATCASVNDVVCHGFPTSNLLKDGDIVTIDMVVNLNGWLADSGWTYPVGLISKEAQNLLDITKKSLYLGIQKAVLGNRIGDVSYEIQSYVESQGLSVVRALTGHGIGTTMHEDPTVPHFGKPGRGTRITEGMVFTIEPMVNIGSYDVNFESDGWTVRTLDGSLSAQYEHTIAITKNGPLILTDQDET